ncbi:MAG: DUF362 domain-containing protein [Verrucomicrobia bacterium]|nr:DUF362 domain-containing protein [Verrucomicrobiota bacterium]
MPGNHTVAIVRCDQYTHDALRAAIRRGFDLLGGAARFIRHGESILLKPNMLAADLPERCVTTHPTVLGAAIQCCREAGARVAVGDSPALSRQSTVARTSGLGEAAAAYGVEMTDFSAARTVSFREGVQNKQFTVAGAALEADGIINLCKLKTHGLTRLTGAVKNVFGCVVGLEKAKFHMRLPDPDLFGRMLVDLVRLLKPRLHIMDAVMAMEGNGPRGGQPRHVGLLLMSADPVALDATASRLIGLDPAFVPTNAAGEAAGLGVMQADLIEIVGERLADVAVKGFDVVAKRPSIMPKRGIMRLLRDHVVPRPVIVPERCIRCGQCVDVCPTDPKSVDWADGEGGAPDRTRPPRHHYPTCIRCYCCQELCPESAIVIKTPLLGRLIPV